MTYINTATGAYPLSAADVRAIHPSTSFPSDAIGFEKSIVGLGYAVVQPVNPPQVSYTENLAEGAPELSDGVYRQTWQVIPASEQEIAERTAAQAATVRQERNQRLANCDWTQLGDAPVDVAAWATYRQELRDVTNQDGFPWEVDWPSIQGELVRARNELGQYVADDLTTPENEAWTAPSA